MKASIIFLFLGLSGCLVQYDQYQPIIACATPGEVNPIHLTFDAVAIGPQVRIYEHGVLVVDTCTAGPLQNQFPYYSLHAIDGTNDREIEIDLGETELPTDGDFSIDDAPDCASPFQRFGTASVVYKFTYSQASGASACSAPIVSDDQRIQFSVDLFLPPMNP
jgi:hypothetical protein